MGDNKKEQAEAIVAMLPVAVNLTTQIVGLARTLGEDGVDIPGIDELKKLNRELRALEDLS